MVAYGKINTRLSPNRRGRRPDPSACGREGGMEGEEGGRGKGEGWREGREGGKEGEGGEGGREGGRGGRDDCYTIQ